MQPYPPPGQYILPKKENLFGKRLKEIWGKITDKIKAHKLVLGISAGVVALLIALVAFIPDLGFRWELAMVSKDEGAMTEHFDEKKAVKAASLIPEKAKVKSSEMVSGYTEFEVTDVGGRKFIIDAFEAMFKPVSSFATSDSDDFKKNQQLYAAIQDSKKVSDNKKRAVASVYSAYIESCAVGFYANKSNPQRNSADFSMLEGLTGFDDIDRALAANTSITAEKITPDFFVRFRAVDQMTESCVRDKIYFIGTPRKYVDNADKLSGEDRAESIKFLKRYAEYNSDFYADECYYKLHFPKISKKGPGDDIAEIFADKYDPDNDKTVLSADDMEHIKEYPDYADDPAVPKSVYALKSSKALPVKGEKASANYELITNPRKTRYFSFAAVKTSKYKTVTYSGTLAGTRVAMDVDFYAEKHTVTLYSGQTGKKTAEKSFEKKAPAPRSITVYFRLNSNGTLDLSSLEFDDKVYPAKWTSKDDEAIVKWLNTTVK